MCIRAASGVLVDDRQWLQLKSGPLAEAFVFFAPETLVTLGGCNR